MSLPIRRLLFVLAASAFVMLTPQHMRAAFSTGNLVVVRMGNGASALGSAATAVFLDEYATVAGPVQRTIALPTTSSGVNVRLTASGSATSEGYLTRSSDGHYLAVAGYDAAVGTASVATAAGIDRVVARIDANGVVDTSTHFSDGFAGGNVRGAVTTDGSVFWVGGVGSAATGGVRSIGFGATSGSFVSGDVANVRTVNIFANQLYLSSASGAFQGVSAVGSGTPQTASTTTLLPGFPTAAGPSPYAFTLLDLDATPGVETAYVADDRAPASGGGIQRWKLVAGIWKLQYTLSNGISVGVRGVTADVSGPSPVLYATTADTASNRLVKVTDTGVNSNVIVLAVAPPNTSFRGVAFAPTPIVAPPLPPPPTPGVVVSESGGNTSVTEGSGTDSYTIALKTAPAGPVQVRASSGSQTELSLDGVTFGPGVAVVLNSLTPVTVFVRAVDDFVAENATTSTISHSIVASSDPAYSDALTPVSAVVAAVADNDVVTIPVHDLQGTGAESPYKGQAVTTMGVVTARKSNGFYVQTPDGMTDNDPLTSEGIFVFGTPVSAAAAVGNLVLVSGTVSEFIPSADPGSPPTTELVSPVVTLLSSGNALPTPASVSASAMQPGPSPFEAFEGMRVSIATLTVVSPTDGFVNEASASSTSSGVFHGVLPGIVRPFREPGLEAGDPAPSEASSPATLPRFDANPERIRVETTTLGGTALDVTSFATVTNLVGVFDFRFRASTLLVEPGATPTVTGNISAVPVRTRNEGEFTVASFNLERFFDTDNDRSKDDVALTQAAFDRRLAKSSLAIRDVLRLPDVIGVEEVENLGALQAIAGRVNSDAAATGVNYQAYLEEGNDVGGIDVGFLVNTNAVQVVSVTQVGKDATYLPPGTTTPALLNDRPSLVLRARMLQPGYPSYPVTVIVNHLRSLSGVDDPVDGERVRTKRRAQAEWLANYIQGRQAANPAERIISLGDYNAFQFNDGFVDVLGTITGTPTDATQVAQASADLVEPDLTDLVDNAPADQRYSFLFDGNAQALDHILVTSNLAGSIGYARNNADFPESYRNDATRPERISDHDMVVGYFALDPDTTAPVLTLPAALTVEAVGALTPVTFTATAADEVDGTIAATCTPASGTSFEVGETTVSCTATDAHHNTATPATFTVTVSDTTAPVLSLPAAFSLEATGPEGAAIFYTAAATDLVDGAVVPLCSVVSGGYAAVGETVVSCSATDGHGNTAAGSFAVTVTDSIAPTLTVPDPIEAEATGASGALVAFAATASDLVGGTTPVNCTPGSGSIFPLGATLVSCSTQDALHNSASAAFAVTVVDTLPPVLLLPDPIQVQAVDSSGRVVTFTASAVDIVSGALAATCAPASGSLFPVGTTNVTCSATDVAGHTATGSFTVTVTPPPPPPPPPTPTPAPTPSLGTQLATLLSMVTTAGPGKSLQAKARTVQLLLATGNTAGAAAALQDLINEVKAQSGKSIPVPTAQAITTAVVTIRHLLGY